MKYPYEVQFPNTDGRIGCMPCKTLTDAKRYIGLYANGIVGTGIVTKTSGVR